MDALPALALGALALAGAGTLARRALRRAEARMRRRCEAEWEDLCAMPDDEREDRTRSRARTMPYLRPLDGARVDRVRSAA